MRLGYTEKARGGFIKHHKSDNPPFVSELNTHKKCSMPVCLCSCADILAYQKQPRGTIPINDNTTSPPKDDILIVYEYLKKCKHYFLATSENGQPRVRPFRAVSVLEGKLYIQTGKKKVVSRQIKKNPKIKLCCMTNGTWLRIEAEAELDERLQSQQALLDKYLYLNKEYCAGDGNDETAENSV